MEELVILIEKKLEEIQETLNKLNTLRQDFDNLKSQIDTAKNKPPIGKVGRTPRPGRHLKKRNF